MTDERRRQYQAAYYQRTKTKRRAAWLHRYQTDPTFRKRHQKSARLHSRLVTSLRKLEPKPERPTGRTRALPRVVTIDGRQVRVYTVGDIAVLVNRGVKAVRFWVTQGSLPAPAYRDKGRGWFLFSEAQRGVIERAATESGIGALRGANPFAPETRSALAQFFALARKRWPA